MLRLCIHRIVNNQCPKSSLAGCLRPSIASRLHGRYGKPKDYRISQTNEIFDIATAVPTFSTCRRLNTVAYKSEDPSKIPVDNLTKAKDGMLTLEQAFSRFEDRCQRAERVNEKDFIKIFDLLTKVVEDLDSSNQMTGDFKVSLSLSSAILLRCCGKLMVDTPEKIRELLAGNLWHFIKEKKIPVDISHYNSLIRALNENQTNFDPQKLLDEINEANLKPDRITLQRLIHQYCVQGNISGATILLEKMKDLDMRLNELTFASLIIGYSKQENPPSMAEIFDLMRSNGVEPGSSSFTAAIISQVELLSKNSAAATEELENIYNLIEKDEIQFNLNEVIDLMTKLSPMKKNELVAKILNLVSICPWSANSRHRLYSTLFKINEYEEASRLYWERKPSEKALKSSNLGLYYIRLLAGNKNVPIEHSLAECIKLKEMDHNKKAYHHLFYHAAESGNLELVRAALKKIGEEEQLKSLYFYPLIAQAKDEQDLIYVLKNDLNPNMDTNDLVDLFSQWIWPRFSNNVSRLFEMNKELHYDKNLLMASFLNYSVQEDKIMEAIKFVSEAPQELVDTGVDKDNSNVVEEPSLNHKFRTLNERGSLIGRLLFQIAEQTKDPAIVNKAFNLCQIPTNQLSSRNLKALVNVHLLNDDFKSALDVFLKISSEHRLTPCQKELMCYCLSNKDPENLQKIMNVATDLYGEMNALFDLAVCCLQCDKLKQAQKIFASPGFRVNPNRVYQICAILSNSSNINVLENFVHLTRDMFDVSQERLYQILINVYERTSNGSRALDLWNRMQEEDFQPSKRSLIMIAEVLERNNIEVPFQKPKMDLKSRDRK